MIKIKKIVSIIQTLLENRRFFVEMDGRKSRWRLQKNGLPQGSVLAPTLFNIYTNDQPEFDLTRRFIYADDLCLATQSTSFNAIETRLTDALSSLTNYYTENSLNANPSKTQVCAFHLNNHQTNTKLEITWKDQPLKYDEYPVYLGVFLDITLSFSQHAMNVKAKVAARNSLLRKLANSNWGADPKTLRTTALTLSYSTAEYSSAVWARSFHAKKVDAELNNACRIVTGQLRPSPLPLP
ncbi:retrovirus-related Pol polyprotein from type-1 retrotransposable element R1 [Elysia marginata]|uniref:Retrovirus-related Pol polyprotein from type-1 retrotransposable element R1 n=1 Tax=Elysia marginata TaxID=1093978 RepID=A0AAV4IKY7_9GAST|nr:retrovirus-related Pol polyprotein from type-1 retrotransposable element R1 [Elysia marginata]